MTGVDYTLIDLVSIDDVFVSAFAISPELASAGWTGTFKVQSDSVLVNFSQVPEPASRTFLLLGIFAWSAKRRRMS